MIDVYILNKNLERIGIIDTYKSLIWAKRYYETGDCELYVPASNEYLNLLKKGNYIVRDDDDMVCRIKKVELDTDIENGNYLIVTGYDMKDVLGQRVIWSQSNINGNVETYIRNIVKNSLVDPTLSARQIKNGSGRANFFLGNSAGFTEVTTEQVSYKSVKEKVEEICKKYEWGYKVIADESVGNFYFLLYKGTDRSNSVIFSPNYENLISTTYIDDSSNIANVALVAGEGEGSNRSRNVSGYAESLDRYEISVDARDISKTITWEELRKMYPTVDQGGQGYITTEGTAYVYRMNYVNILIVDDNQLTELQAAYPTGQIVTISGIRYYQVYNATIADIPSNTLQDGDDVILRDIIYSVYLLTRGYEKMAEYGATISYEGVVSDNTFKYKTDYFMGDDVTVINEYGIQTTAKIVEVIEVSDENGYSIEPKFEYSSMSQNYLLTEDNEVLITELGEELEV